MIIMRHKFYYTLSLYLKDNKNLNKTKDFLYLSIKNYYLTIKRYKYVPLYSAKQGINFIYSNMYFLNLLQNKHIDK